MTRTFHINKKRIDVDDDFVRIRQNIKKGPGDQDVLIPKSQVISFDTPSRFGPPKKNIKWVEVSVTEFIWNKLELYVQLKTLINHSSAVIEGMTQFGINWDYILLRKKNPKICFYCMNNLKGDKTKDHVIPKVMLKAFNIKTIPNNLVNCCRECNQEKASLEPGTFKKAVQFKLHQTGDVRYRKILSVLNELVIENGTESNYPGSEGFFTKKL